MKTFEEWYHRAPFDGTADMAEAWKVDREIVAAEARKEGIDEACSLLTWKAAGVVRRKLLTGRLKEKGK